MNKNLILSIYEYREMLKSMTKRELRARYKGSALGFAWTFLNPLLTLAIYAIVFSTIFRVAVPGYSYTLFLFIGLVGWNFTAQTVNQATTIINANNNLVKKIYFQREILPISMVTTNFINMLLTFVIVLIVLFFNNIFISIQFIQLIPLLIIHYILNLGIALLLSSMGVYFRDLEHIVGVMTMAWMYCTPILYTDDLIPDRLYWLFKLNPMFYIVQSYRNILLFHTNIDIYGTLYVLLLSIVLLMIGSFVFDKLQRRFAEVI